MKILTKVKKDYTGCNGCYYFNPLHISVICSKPKDVSCVDQKRSEQTGDVFHTFHIFEVTNINLKLI